MTTTHMVGSTTRPYNKLSYQEAYERIAEAGYTDLAVFGNAGSVPVRAESTSGEVASVRRAAAAAGLTPSMLLGSTRLELGLEAAVADYRRLIDNCVALGATWLLDLGTGKEEDYENYFELMRQAAHAHPGFVVVVGVGGSVLEARNPGHTFQIGHHVDFHRRSLGISGRISPLLRLLRLRQGSPSRTRA
jgi:sugar phosphate isomerase/epimerase